HQVCSAALGGLRKPAVPPSFTAAADRLQNQLNEWSRMSDEQRTDEFVAELRSRFADLVKSVEAYFDRQRQFPYTKGMAVPEFAGIPSHDEDGLLGPGLHHATWDEFAARFGTNDLRQRKMFGLLAGMHMAKEAGSQWVNVGGSFVTAKEL